MSYNYTLEARARFNDERKKIMEIKMMEDLDGDIVLAAEKICALLNEEMAAHSKGFCDYLERYAAKNYMISPENLVSFITQKQADRKQINGKADLLTKQRIEKCLQEGFVPQKRDFVFRLAFILGMNDEECEELLTKGMDERGFNFKNPQEVIYWYCLKFGYGYLYSQALMEKYNAINVSSASPGDIFTADIHDDFISRFSNSPLTGNNAEDTLIQCLTEIKSMYPVNYINDDVCNLRLNSEFSETLSQVRKALSEYNLALEDYNKNLEKRLKAEGGNVDGTWHSDADGNASLYDVAKFIYRDHPHYEALGIKKYITDIPAGMFLLPAELTAHRLTKERLHFIADENKSRFPSRQDLITITFIDYLFSLADRRHSRTERFDDFCEVVNTSLYRCGMPDLNPNNIYEFFIMLCMYTDDPHGAFQEVYIRSVKNKEM